MSPRTILFPSVRQEPTLVALEGAPLPTTTGNHERPPFLLQLTSAALMNADNHSRYSRTSSPADRPDPAAATGTCLSLVSLWCGQLARVHWSGKEQEILLTTFISLLFYNPSYPILFFPAPRSWTQESGQRSSAWAEDLRLTTSSWQRTWILVLVGPNSSPPLEAREKSRTPGYLQVAGDICKATPFFLFLFHTLRPLLSPFLLFQPGLFSSLWIPKVFAYSVCQYLGLKFWVFVRDFLRGYALSSSSFVLSVWGEIIMC